MKRRMTQPEVNHLRRLLGWVRCEFGQSPDEFEATLRKIAPAIRDVDDEGKARLQRSFEKGARVPKYVRAAVKSLEKIVAQEVGDVIEAETSAGIEDQKTTEQIKPPAASVPAARPAERGSSGRLIAQDEERLNPPPKGARNGLNTPK